MRADIEPILKSTQKVINRQPKLSGDYANWLYVFPSVSAFLFLGQNTLLSKIVELNSKPVNICKTNYNYSFILLIK